MHNIKYFIDHLECPKVNGLIFPDGSIQLIDVKVNWTPSTKYIIEKSVKTRIETLQENNKLTWGKCAILVSHADENYSIEVLGGEADYGSDGFVAVIDKDSKQLIWIAFFLDSNPFNEIKILDEHIYAKTTIGCIWKFNLVSPTGFTVDCHS